MKTPNSTTVSYASAADFLAYLDANLLGDLARDDGARDTPQQVLVDPVVTQHLLRATGRIEALAVRGRRYDPEDLSALAALSPPSASTHYLRWLTCGLAYETLRWRRGNLEGDASPFKDEVKGALEALADGSDVFAFAETEQAGVPATRPITAGEWDALNLETSRSRFWGCVRPQSSGYRRG